MTYFKITFNHSLLLAIAITQQVREYSRYVNAVFLAS